MRGPISLFKRVCDPLLGGSDGRALFESLLEGLG